MKVACHQPCYLPWPGFFYKALRADTLVLLDSVQLPRGTSWVTRNRIKTPAGQGWLTVPIRRKGMGLQRIVDVQIYSERDWQRTHLGSLAHAYKRSPFFEDHSQLLEEVYGRTWERLADLNVFLARRLLEVLGISLDIRLSSDMDVNLTGTNLIVEICTRTNADTYTTMSASRNYLDQDLFDRSGVRMDLYNFRCPVYPQPWGRFAPNLSTVDMLFNCGPKTCGIIEKGGR